MSRSVARKWCDNGWKYIAKEIIGERWVYSMSKRERDMMDVRRGERWRPGRRRMMASKVNADVRRHFPSFVSLHKKNMNLAKLIK
jgi:hypothetical protein